MSIIRTALLLLALAGCRGDRIEYHRVEFPGFSFEVPTFITYGRDHATEYRAGGVEGKNGRQLVQLMWRLGATTSAEELPALVRAMMGMALPDSKALQYEPARAIQIGGHDATQVDARSQTEQLSFTEIACGKRAVMVSTFARGNVGAMRDRILGSFDCHPTEAQEAVISTAAPFGIDDPALLAGWHRVNSDDQFMMSNGELQVIVLQKPRLDERIAKKLDQYLPMMLGAGGGSWTSSRSETRQTQGGERAFHHGRMTLEGETMDMVVSMWNCPDRADAMMVLAMAPGSKLDPAIDLLAKLRCAAPGDPPLPLAPAPPEAAPESAPPTPAPPGSAPPSP